MKFNRIKTTFLLAALSGLFLLLGALFGGQAGMKIALVMALIINVTMYYFSDRIVLRLYNAQPLDQHTYGWIYDIVEELAKRMHMPMPKLWIIHTPMANAFATGRSPKHASVAVTTGILNILDKHELRGVLAHELSHVQNRDILVSTIAATLASAIGYLANMLHRNAFWSSIGSRNRDNNQKGSPPVALFIIALLMPIAASLIQLAISRSREYLADETGADMCGDPLALASALEKLHNHIPIAHLNPQDSAKAATASLFILSPFRIDKSLLSWFSTHPPMHKRVARLKELFEKKYVHKKW